MTTRPLALTRDRILGHRRRVQALDERLPPGPESLRRAAWAGLQDSMPRAALLSIHARVAGTGPATWEDPSLVQLWGPRFGAYVVARRDIAPFSLGRLPNDAKGRRRAQDLAARLDAFLAGRTELTYGQAGDGLGVHPNLLRYAAATGTVLIRWTGAGAPTIRTVPGPEATPLEARLELARRYLHLFGPTTAASFRRWAGIGAAEARHAFDELAPSLVPAGSPIGQGWILESDEPSFRAVAGRGAPARLLPSGDPYYLLHGVDREVLVPERSRRSELWTPRVWPGALLVRGDVVGTWRRDGPNVTIATWRRLLPQERADVETEATSLPLPDVGVPLRVVWTD